MVTVNVAYCCKCCLMPFQHSDIKLLLSSNSSCYLLINSDINKTAILEFHETCRSVTFYFMKKDSTRCCDTTSPESIHTKDESKRGIAFAFIFAVNWLCRRGVTASFGVFFHEIKCNGMTSFMEFKYCCLLLNFPQSNWLFKARG